MHFSYGAFFQRSHRKASLSGGCQKYRDASLQLNTTISKAAGICEDPENGFHIKLCVCVCLNWVLRITQTPEWHGRVRELAHNEGDVPQLLPVSDTSLNQELREVQDEKVPVVVKASVCARLGLLMICRLDVFFIITEHRTRLLHQRRGTLSKQNIDSHVCFHRRTSAKLLLLLQHKH